MPKKRSASPLFSELVFKSFLAAVSGLAIVGLVFFIAHQQTIFCANSTSCVNNLTATVENGIPGFFEGQIVMPPTINLADSTTDSYVLGDTAPAGDKHIYVDLSTQTLYAFQGNSLILNTLISSGKWHATPTGDFHIWVKLKSTRMSGGSGADAYDLPNVPYTMFFYNDQVSKMQGFSLHGAYWHNNFGHMMSHGCVNMRTIDAEALYNWADPATDGTTTYVTPENPGTVVSICKEIQMETGAAPVCLE